MLCLHCPHHISILKVLRFPNTTLKRPLHASSIAAAKAHRYLSSPLVVTCVVKAWKGHLNFVLSLLGCSPHAVVLLTDKELRVRPCFSCQGLLPHRHPCGSICPMAAQGRRICYPDISRRTQGQCGRQPGTPDGRPYCNYCP